MVDKGSVLERTGLKKVQILCRERKITMFSFPQFGDMVIIIAFSLYYGSWIWLVIF